MNRRRQADIRLPGCTRHDRSTVRRGLPHMCVVAFCALGFCLAPYNHLFSNEFRLRDTLVPTRNGQFGKTERSLSAGQEHVRVASTKHASPDKPCVSLARNNDFACRCRQERGPPQKSALDKCFADDFWKSKQSKC